MLGRQSEELRKSESVSSGRPEIARSCPERVPSGFGFPSLSSNPSRPFKEGLPGLEGAEEFPVLAAPDEVFTLPISLPTLAKIGSQSLILQLGPAPAR
jgi:hypothetical protein